MEVKHLSASDVDLDMTIATDYARAVGYLERARLPAYVSFVEESSARGLAHEADPKHRIYVRTSDGAVVSGVPPADAHVIVSDNGDSDNPFRKSGFFDARCYVPKSEDRTAWNGQAALRFTLQPTCNKDNGISELYADPQTLRPIAVDGNIADTDDSAMTVALEVRYATVGAYTVPSGIRAHAVGHGWLFWARERVNVDYTKYQFYTTQEAVRRQASGP